MQKNGVIRDRKGFSTLLLLVLGFVFFLITSVVVFQIQSENDQMVEATRSQTSESRLDFIAQTIQADFYNTFLQGEFENIVATFLINGEHVIDPDNTFKQNMGGKLEQFLLEAANSLMTKGAAAQIYAKAYSAVPSISCTPKELQGGSAQVWLREVESGILELGGMSVGQRIFCEDTEESNSQEISLRARNYQLYSRAIQMHDMAVRAIKSAKLQLDGEEGVVRLARGWKVAGDESSRTEILEGPRGWRSKVGMVSALMAMEEDGILLEPLSMRILNDRGETFNVNDIKGVGCYGDVRSGPEGNAGPTQTCRPDDIELVIGKEPDDAENAIKLKFKPDMSKSELGITVEEAGVKVEIRSEALGKLIAKLVEDILKDTTEGYVRYSGVTRLCNTFVGKPDSVIISGRVLETKDEFVPHNVPEGVVSMRFVSTRQNLEPSNLRDDADCSDEEHKDVIKTNVIMLLTEDLEKKLELSLVKEEGKAKVNKNQLTELQRRINNNEMVKNTGEQRVINLQASVWAGGKEISKTRPDESATRITSDEDEATGVLGTGEAPAERRRGGVTERSGEAVETGDLETALGELMRIPETVSGAMSKIGRLGDSEAAARTAAAMCKLMGLKNWMDLDDVGKALMAICGIGNVFGDVDTKVICNLAALYQAVESGSMRAVLAMLANILGKEGFDFMVTTEMIQAALQAGDTEDVLMAASAAARLAGDIEAADYLAQLAQIIHGIKSGDVLDLVANLLSRLGDHDLANVMAALEGLWRGIEEEDFLATLRALNQLAKQFGYSGVARLEGLLGQIQGNFDLIMNFDKALEICKDKIPWDIVCTIPEVGGGVCPEKRPCIGGGMGEFSYGLPSFELPKLCNDMFFKLGFQIDCTCVYACATTPNVMYYPKSVGIDLRMIMMLLDEDFYLEIIGGINLEQLKAFCKLDP